MLPIPVLVSLALGILVALVLLLVGSLRRAHGHGMPLGTVVYSDARDTGRLLRSPHRPLSGKPDYVLRTARGTYIPVEYKSYRCGTHPPHADLIQIGAYLLLLEDLYDRAPPFGVLRYADRTLRIPFSRALRAEILALLERVQAEDGTPSEPTPQHQTCRDCPFVPICEEAIRT